jgi:hypothetical protein
VQALEGALDPARAQARTLSEKLGTGGSVLPRQRAGLSRLRNRKPVAEARLWRAEASDPSAEPGGPREAIALRAQVGPPGRPVARLRQLPARGPQPQHDCAVPGAGGAPSASAPRPTTPTGGRVDIISSGLDGRSHEVPYRGPRGADSDDASHVPSPHRLDDGLRALPRDSGLGRRPWTKAGEHRVGAGISPRVPVQLPARLAPPLPASRSSRGAPVLVRTTSDGASRWRTGVVRVPSIRSSRARTARRPISGRG